MPPINKRLKQPILGTTAAQQDYKDLFKKFALNPDN